MQRERKDFGQKQPEAPRSKSSFLLSEDLQGGSEAGLSLSPGVALSSKNLLKKDRKPSWDPKTHQNQE